jgi:hypothetical protein
MPVIVENSYIIPATRGSPSFRCVLGRLELPIGGYNVCQKWLKESKGNTLSAEDIAHYHKIVISLSETIRLMAEIDEVIETHGGWPGAFAGDAKS